MSPDTLATWATATAAAATVVIAIATVVTAWLTRVLANENRLLRRAGTEPEVVAYLMPDTRYKTMLNLVVANIGQGPARNVRFRLEGNPEDFARHKVQVRDDPHRSALSVLPQGERLTAFFGAGYELFAKPQLQPFVVRVSYEDLAGGRHSGEFRLDISQFDGLITLGEPPEHETAEALKKLANAIEAWRSTGFRVEVITTRDRERREQRARDATRERLGRTPRRNEGQVTT